MRRKLKIVIIFSVILILCLGGLWIRERNLHSSARGAYEKNLLSHSAELKYSDFEGSNVSNGSNENHGSRDPHKEDRAEGPEYAGFRDYIMTMDPETQKIPEKAWLMAVKNIESEFSRGRLKSGDAFDWEEIPSNTGGRTRAIMYDPTDPEHRKVWAGSVTGGLWYREDIKGDDTWQRVDDFWPSLAVSCIAYDPNDPAVFYVGTGEGQTAVHIYRESSGRGSGIWKSSNKGKNWELLASTEDFEYVTDIAVRNESGKSVIYAGVASGIYKGETHTSKPHDGLYRSDDAGGSWTQVLPDIPGENTPYTPAHIEITSAGRLFIGCMRNVFQKGGGRILRSDNGTEWTVMDYYVPLIEARTVNNIPGRVILASAPSDSNRLYAILAGGAADPRNGFIYSRGVMIIKSSDAGESWQQIPMPPPYEGEAEGQWSFLAWHALCAAVQPDNPDVVWIGGLDLYRSDDGGWSWYQKTLWWNFGKWYVPEYPVYVHADQHSLVYKPGSSSELLNSNDGGVFLATNSRDPAPTFKEINQGYNTLQYYSCALHPHAGERYFLGGCQDNGTFRTTNEPTSKNVSVSYGDGAICFIDENEPNIQISCSQFNYYYYSTDGNHSKTYNFNFIGGTFINPVDYDDGDNILYANAMDFEGRYRDSIFRINLLNDSVLSPDLVPARTGSTLPFSAIHVVPGKVEGNTRVLAGSQSGRLFRLDNAQSDINSVEIGSMDFPVAYISCIQTGSSGNQILVTFSNYGVKHVWETLDGGEKWKDMSGNLPDIPVRWAIYTPGVPGSVMLATELGIWYTMDIGLDPVEWVQADNFPNVRVDMLSPRKSDGHILAATHGRGLFLSSGLTPLSSPAPVSPEGNISIYPNPASEFINIEIHSQKNGQWTLGVYDLEGKLQKQVEPGNMGKEFSYRMTLDELVPGVYVIRAETEDRYYSQTFIKRDFK